MKTMTLPHPVEEAKKHTSAIEIAETTEELDKQIAYLKTDFGAALPVESGNQKSVTAQVELLERKKNDRAIVDLFPNARIFHPKEPCGWRDESGMPVLAPFGIDDPVCKFSHKGLWHHAKNTWVVPSCYEDIPARLFRCWGALCSCMFLLIPLLVSGAILSWISFCGKLSDSPGLVTVFFWLIASFGYVHVLLVAVENNKLSYLSQHYVAQAIFQGLIPKPARVVILRAKEAQKNKLFQDVFLLAEVPKWEIALEPRPVRTWDGCPLIIAFDGEKHWLLDSFNVTPVEMMAAGYMDTPPKS